MPYYRLIDQTDKTVLDIKFMDSDVANILNQQRTDNKKWIKGLARKSKKNPVGSLNRILRTLGTEDFDEYSVNTVNQWLERDKNKKIKKQEEFEKIQNLFSEFMSTQTLKNHKLVDKFIALQTGNTFEAGLRLGLAGRLLNDNQNSNC